MAAVDYFLKIDGVPGESLDNHHPNEIDVESWSWGESNSAEAGPGRGAAGKVDIQDFHFTSRISKASPALMLACASGKHIKSAVLTARKAGGAQAEFLVIKFSDVIVSSVQTSGSSDMVPMDSTSLGFSKIEVEYRETKPDGTLGASTVFGWDLKKNKKL
ncbi:MAG: Hcp family type VI secretion system effector [Actinomycetota bacterium]